MMIILVLAVSTCALLAQPKPLAHYDLHPVILEGSDVKITIGDELIIEAPHGKPARIQLRKIIEPLIAQPVYEISGQFAYTFVDAEGYLEMWNDFGDKGRFFTRTLATSGPMAHIIGDSGGVRTFSLPFDTMNKTSAPKILEINLVLPKGGNVGFMKGVQLSDFPSMAAWAAKYPTDSGQAFTKIPLYTLSIFASFLGLLGITTGLSALRFPKWALGCAWTGLGMGILLLIAGFVAPFSGEPMNYSYSLLAGGILVTALFTGLRWYVSRLRQKQELRRMVAMDLG